MIAKCGEDADVGAVMMTGTGAAFCSGGDVKGMGDNASRKEVSSEEKVALLRDRQRRLTGALVSLRKPTVAALPGPAAGAGLSIALACDLRIAAESAFVSTGYAKVGLSGDYGICWLLTRIVGPARARELMFTSEKVDARRCEALGLVNRVVPDDQVRQAAFDLARALAHGPVGAYALMKDNLDEALLTDFHTALDGEAERMVRCAGSDDHREAIAAFIAKRAPAFSRAPDRNL
jgi:enoyl-CoA hydratase/carnithine racemase